MFYLHLFILVEILFGKEILSLVIPTCQDSTSSVNMANPYLSEGVIEVLISSDHIPVIGVTNVEGNVPVTGTVTFEGQVHAFGNVKVVAKSRPSSKSCYKTSKFPLAIMLVSPYSPTGMKMPIIPIILPTKTLPVKSTTPRVYSFIPQPTSLVTPTILSTTSLPAVTVSVPKITVPSVSTKDITGYNKVAISEDELSLSGSTFVDAVPPKIEDFIFGYIPAKGSVVITCKSF